MVSLRCEAAGCTELQTADDKPTYSALKRLHERNVHESGETCQKPPKVNHPVVHKISVKMTGPHSPA
ncbi:hypothetical protein SK128_025885, partial [Halocaridina rubra]